MIFYSSSYLFSYLSRLCFRIYLIEDNIRQGGGHGGEGENDLHVLGADGILGQTEVAQKSSQLPLSGLPCFFRLANKIRDSTSRAVISEVVSLYQLHPVSFFQSRSKKQLSSVIRWKEVTAIGEFGICVM